jgi:hypothetical protein
VTDYQSFHENRVKHMEIIQAVIARLAGNSFLIKGWALTLTGAFLGFAVNRNDSGLAATALLPIVVFWFLDMYYLRTERLFRALYDRVRTDPAVEPFFMAATDKTKFASDLPRGTASWWRTFWRLTLSLYYGPLIAATVLVVIILCSN